MILLFSVDIRFEWFIFEFHEVYVFICVWLYLTFGRAAIRPLVVVGIVVVFWTMPRINGFTLLAVNAAFFAAAAMLILAIVACRDAESWRALSGRLVSDRRTMAMAAVVAVCGLLTVRVGIAMGGGLVGIYWQGDPVLFTLCFLLGLLGMQFGRNAVAGAAAIIVLVALLQPFLWESLSVPFLNSDSVMFQFTIGPGTTGLVDAAAVVSFYYFGQFLADRAAGMPIRPAHRCWLLGLLAYLVVFGFNPLSIGLDLPPEAGRGRWWWIARENDLLILIAVWGALLYGWVSGAAYVVLAVVASLPLLLLLDPAGSTLLEFGSGAVKLRIGDLFVTKSVPVTLFSYVFQAGLIALLADEISRYLRSGDLFAAATLAPLPARRAGPVTKHRASRRRSRQPTARPDSVPPVMPRR